MSKDNKFKFYLTNFVTSLRAVGVLIIIPVYYLYGGLSAFLLSAGCFLTDYIDGKMARKFKTSTFLGSMFDGITDKAFLIVSLIILMTITPLAIVPILMELGIVGMQTLKYKNDMSVKSNIIGKAKMWLAGLTMAACYLLVDKRVLNYLGASLATKINSFGQLKLFSLVLTPLVLSEIITLTSYIKEYNEEKKEPEKIEEKKDEEEKIKEEVHDMTLKDLLLDHEIYEKYKDYGDLRLIRKLSKKK